MPSSWMDSIKKGEMVGLELTDMSAAFNCVNVGLLLAITKLYKFSRHAQQFVWSFMEGLQVMDVKGSTSSTLRVRSRSGGMVAWRGPGIDLWPAVVPDLHKYAA